MAVRVLQVIGGSQFGGAIWVIESYVRALQEHGCDVTVCTSVERVAEVFERAGCEIVSIPEMGREIHPVKDIVSLVKLTAACRRGGYEVVHTHTSKGGFVGRAAARLARTPVILHTAHGFAFHESSSRRSVRFYTALERLAARWSDRVITVSNFHRDWALRLRIAGPGKIVAIRNGISPERVKATVDRHDVRAALGIDDGALVVTSVARLASQKGLEALIQAMRSVTETYPAARLVLVGDGPLRESLGELSRSLGLSDEVHFLGFRSDVGDILNASDIVVAPSLREGLSIAILESMALGKPTVASDIGSNLELITDGSNGLLVPPEDPEPLTAAILRLLAEPGWAEQLGASARARFEHEFTEDMMKRAVWELYRVLLSEKGIATVPGGTAPSRLGR